jgi:hypothetical protein
MGKCGGAAAWQGRTRTAVYSDSLFPPTPYFVHLNSEFALPATPRCTTMPVRASTTLSCLATEVDRDREPGAWGGPIVRRGASCAGGADFGPVEMTVPGAGKNGTGGGPCSGCGGSKDEESPTRRARPLLIARSRRDCGPTFGGGDCGCGGANAAAAGGGGGMSGGGGVPGGDMSGGGGVPGGDMSGGGGDGADVFDAVEACCSVARVDTDAFAAAERMITALRNQSSNTGAASSVRNISL